MGLALDPCKLAGEECGPFSRYNNCNECCNGGSFRCQKNPQGLVTCFCGKTVEELLTDTQALSAVNKSALEASAAEQAISAAASGEHDGVGNGLTLAACLPDGAECGPSSRYGNCEECCNGGYFNCHHNPAGRISGCNCAKSVEESLTDTQALSAA